MSKSKSTVPSMVSCSFVYHGIGRKHRQCTLKTLFSDALSPLATKIGQLISQQLTHLRTLAADLLFLFSHNFNVL